MTGRSGKYGGAALLALVMLSGCGTTVWLEMLPPEHRIVGPSLDGVWLWGEDSALGLEGEAVQGNSPCVLLKMAVLEMTTVSHFEWSACYHDLNGSMLLELRDEGFFPTYLHLLIESDGEDWKLCWTGDWLLSARADGLVDVPVLKRDHDVLITASGAEMYALYLQHVEDLLRYCREEPDGWATLQRLPLPALKELPFDNSGL